MNLTLTRYHRDPTHGIFGFLSNDDGVAICETLEHSFNGKPIVPPGSYQCLRGLHRLKAGATLFDTFEVTGVDGHWGILFHTGNKNEDSKGCILVGDAFDTSVPMITGSRIAFKRFMEYQQDCGEFTLTVLGKS